MDQVKELAKQIQELKDFCSNLKVNTSANQESLSHLSLCISNILSGDKSFETLKVRLEKSIKAMEKTVHLDQLRIIKLEETMIAVQEFLTAFPNWLFETKLFPLSKIYECMIPLSQKCHTFDARIKKIEEQLSWEFVNNQINNDQNSEIFLNTVSPLILGFSHEQFQNNSSENPEPRI